MTRSSKSFEKSTEDDDLFIFFSKNKGSKQNLNRIHQLGKLII